MILRGLGGSYPVPVGTDANVLPNASLVQQAVDYELEGSGWIFTNRGLLGGIREHEHR